MALPHVFGSKARVHRTAAKEIRHSLDPQPLRHCGRSRNPLPPHHGRFPMKDLGKTAAAKHPRNPLRAKVRGNTELQ